MSLFITIRFIRESAISSEDFSSFLSTMEIKNPLMLLCVTECVWIKRNVAARVIFGRFFFFHVDLVYYATDKSGVQYLITGDCGIFSWCF